MDLKITEEKENILFGRREILGKINSEISPKREEIAKILSQKFSVPSENVKVKNVYGKFGARDFIFQANVYYSKKDRDEIELKKKKDPVAESNQVPAPAVA